MYDTRTRATQVSDDTPVVRFRVYAEPEPPARLDRILGVVVGLMSAGVVAVCVGIILLWLFENTR